MHLSFTAYCNHNVLVIVFVCVSACVCVVITILAGGVNPATTSAVLHGLVLCLLVLCFVFSASSILISLYNSFSNPYETYMGPLGIYVCSSLSGKRYKC